VPVEIGLNPIKNAEGSFVLAAFVDITERKGAEERFRVAVESAPNPVVTIVAPLHLVRRQPARLPPYGDHPHRQLVAARNSPPQRSKRGEADLVDDQHVDAIEAPLVAHARYYNEDRPHMSLDGDAPVAHAVERRDAGKVVALPRVGGLHHRYIRQAA
jgi:hypothetical protein